MRCAIIGALAPALAIAMRLAKLKHDCWLVVQEPEVASHIRQEEERILCTVNAAYAVKRADLVILADGILPPLNKQPFMERGEVSTKSSFLFPTTSHLALWLSPKLSQSHMIMLSASLNVGVTAELRSKLDARVAYVLPWMFHHPLPIVVGTWDGQAVPSIEACFYGIKREFYWMKDEEAEAVQQQLHLGRQHAAIGPSFHRVKERSYSLLSSYLSPAMAERYAEWRYLD
ncbi:NAD(P)-binding domain-containing protein [Paenibacillus sp. 1001270B_150601_E10]|uniref:NAD(P)-binding domain-containing protein n=1 Tax=Paenibacillus sp. 1001270B_150601_E10 TaxID=2787079 RepID=UPI00189F1101|nr:NAD(P)-binding domain-containing protein [Paenibacillus sp. 1001270B_150601_E10]